MKYRRLERVRKISTICTPQFAESIFQTGFGKEQQGTGKEELYDKKTWLFTHE